MDKKIIFSLFGNVLSAFAPMFIPAALYAVIFVRDFGIKISFVATFLVTGFTVLGVGHILNTFGFGHRKRLPVAESALVMLLTYPLISLFGMIPFIVTGWLSPVDAMLEAISDVTSAGLSILPDNAPYILRIWQSSLMWFGSLIFLVMLVTIMPEVGGCFGLSLSLHGGRDFSPIFGQMEDMARRVIKVYCALTAIGFLLFKLAGLDFWDSLLMAMRCISTGGGDFFPAHENIYVQYAAAFTMLLACGNFLFYHRLIYTLQPSTSNGGQNIFRRTINSVIQVKQNVVMNTKHFFANSEVKSLLTIIFLVTGFVFFKLYLSDAYKDGNIVFREVFFHVISFLSTTGINLGTFDRTHDFEKFLIFLMALIGGCMGSVTGGMKIVRLLVLLRITKAELLETIHPKMISVIRVNRIVVPSETIGRILGFFFMSVITLFFSAAILSFTGISFSQAVGAAFGCLTNIGLLPGICDAAFFQNLSVFGKIVCSLILTVGRIEIFALLIVIATLQYSGKGMRKWKIKNMKRTR